MGACGVGAAGRGRRVRAAGRAGETRGTPTASLHHAPYPRSRTRLPHAGHDRQATPKLHQQLQALPLTPTLTLRFRPTLAHRLHLPFHPLTHLPCPGSSPTTPTWSPRSTAGCPRRAQGSTGCRCAARGPRPSQPHPGQHLAHRDTPLFFLPHQPYPPTCRCSPVPFGAVRWTPPVVRSPCGVCNPAHHDVPSFLYSHGMPLALCTRHPSKHLARLPHLGHRPAPPYRQIPCNRYPPPRSYPSLQHFIAPRV